MQLTALGQKLRARVVVKSGGAKAEGDAPPLTVVLMHGFGAPGDDLVSMAHVLDAPHGTRFVFPEAPTVLRDPMMSAFGEARAWWDIDVGRYERAIRTGTLDRLIDEVPEGMAAAREAVIDLLDAVERETSTPSDRIVLGGFSQGSMVAIDVALRTTRPLAGIVVLSGTLLAAPEWLPKIAARKDVPVFQSHGTADPILPYGLAVRLREAFEKAGINVSFTSFEGGHGIPPQVMRDLGQWLTKRT